MREWVEGNYKITQLDSGTVVKTLIGQEPPLVEQPVIISLESKINYIYFKEKGLI